MTGPGRPTTGTKVQVRIPADLLGYVDTHAHDLGITRAEMLRRLVQHGMDTVSYDEMDDWRRAGRP